MSDSDWDDAHLMNTIRRGPPPLTAVLRVTEVHADLRLGEGIRCSRKRVERLMRPAKIAGIYSHRSSRPHHRK